MKDRTSQLLSSLMRMKNNLDAVDCEYWPDGPDLVPSTAAWSSPDSDPRADLTNYVRSISTQMSNYFVDPEMAAHVNAIAKAFPGQGGHHVWHSHAGYHATEAQQAALESVAQGETVDEWEVRRNRLNAGSGPKGPDITHARHNKHRGKGKRKK